MSRPPAIARVLVDSPLPQLDRLFDYAIPAALAADAAPGVRVRVPLRSAGRIADGFIIEIVAEVDYPGTLSELDAVVSTARVLTSDVWALARRVADRAAGNAIDVVRLAVPKRQVRVEKAWIEQADGSTNAPEAEAPEAPTPGESTPGESTPPIVPVDIPAYAAGALERLIADSGRAAVDAVPRLVELADGRWVGSWAVVMSVMAAHALARGSSAILAVPDYRDQEQLVAALSQVLPPARIVHVDARQSGPDRYRAHLACLGATPLAIVGNRSVVYAPAATLGLIAVWDDGDPLHSEPLSPYVHVRDTALVRQEQQGCALAFVSHARSTETQRLVDLGYLEHLAPERVYSPHVIPTSQQAATDGFASFARIPSAAWQATRAAVTSGPVLVQVARPGFAPTLACSDCGHRAQCTVCAGPLRTRTSGGIPSCTWCGIPSARFACPTCSGTRLSLVGQGSVRTADELGRAFPGVRVIVADGEHPILSVPSSPAVVVATRGAEPVAQGGYAAVLLLDGERMLARESLRVGEDCLRWWSNAAALARPQAPVYLVGVGGTLAAAMATWRSDAYAESELVDRRRLRFPPAVRVATVSGAADAVDALIAATSAIPGTDVLGPVPLDSGGARAIVRFDYGSGSAVASALRAGIVSLATSRRQRLPAAATQPARFPAPLRLRVKFDDLEPFFD